MTSQGQNSILFASALELSKKLAAREITSVEIVQSHLDHINRHNHQGRKLNAIISTRPIEQALAEAKKLDEERQSGRVRSPLHGIPILLKDAVVTAAALGMPTTAGAAVFGTMMARANASLVDRLIDAGLIILGKTNMTEYCGMKSNNTPMGWSAYAGQTLSAYRRNDLAEEDQPFSAGSSAGSAVGVAAGFAPLAIGTETAGSTVYPASASAIYGMRLTSGTVPTDGVQKISWSFDSIGVMARDPADLVPLAAILQGREASGASSMAKGFQGLSVGVFGSTWAIGSKGKWDSPEVVAQYELGVKKMQDNGAKVKYPVDAKDPNDQLKYNDATLTSVAYHEFPTMFKEFIGCFEPNPEVTDLKDVVAWNEKHAEKAMPAPYTTQTELIAATINKMTDEDAATAVHELHRLAGPDWMDKIMEDHGLDILLAASEATIVAVSACAGWPICSVPLTKLEKSGQPYGYFAMAKAGREDVLVRFLEAWRDVFGVFEPPRLED